VWGRKSRGSTASSKRWRWWWVKVRPHSCDDYIHTLTQLRWPYAFKILLSFCFLLAYKPTNGNSSFIALFNLAWLHAFYFILLLLLLLLLLGKNISFFFRFPPFRLIYNYENACWASRERYFFLFFHSLKDGFWLRFILSKSIDMDLFG